MNTIVKLCFIWPLLFAIAAPGQAGELVAHKASYSAKIKKGISIEGQAVRELQQSENGQWLYSFKVRSFLADIDEATHLSWQNNKVLPHSYNYKLSAPLTRDRRKKVNFDWDKMVALNPLKKKGWTITDIPQNTFDRLSFQLQLAMDVQSGQQDMRYGVADKGKIRENRFRVTGEEKIQTAFGVINSISVEKVRDKGKKRQTTMWFSKQYPFLLLRMLQVEKDGEQYEINITAASIDNKSVTFN